MSVALCITAKLTANVRVGTRSSDDFRFRGPKLECDVLSLNMSKFTQPFAKFVLERLRVRGPYVERAYSSNLGLLRARRERPPRPIAVDILSLQSMLEGFG